MHGFDGICPTPALGDRVSLRYRVRNRLDAMIDQNSPQRPTHVRHTIVGITAFAAFLMYLDRICMGQMLNDKQLQRDLHLGDHQIAFVLSIFFWAYALGQVPAGWLADRFRTRPFFSWLIAIWSGCTLLTGLASGFWSLLIARI